MARKCPCTWTYVNLTEHSESPLLLHISPPVSTMYIDTSYLGILDQMEHWFILDDFLILNVLKKYIIAIYGSGDKYEPWEVLGPSGPRLLGCGPSGLLDNVLHALRALTPCDPRNRAMMG